nr:hypothetical protein [Tanacetum cinerariifolium]
MGFSLDGKIVVRFYLGFYGLDLQKKVVPSKVVVEKDDEMLMLVFDEALGVGDGVAHPWRSGETLWKSAEEALLMEKIQIEQQRLGVDEMYWVGNKRYEEEQEEQEEEEDE